MYRSLSDAEKSVLSKVLNFVPISKNLDEFSVKQDVENFFRHVQLKAFFHDKEDDSNTSDKDIFETLQTRKSKWTPPEGQFASLDFFINKCRHDINKLNFNGNTKFSNLSSEERAALKNLSKRRDIIVKAADKGSALVVWRADLYQKEALRQLSNTSFYAKVDKDLTSTNQQIVKSTINELIVKQDLPAKYTWEISNTSLAFLDIKVSAEGNGLCTSVHYKPTDSHISFVIFIFTSITRQECYSLFSVS